MPPTFWQPLQPQVSSRCCWNRCGASIIRRGGGLLSIFTPASPWQVKVGNEDDTALRDSPGGSSPLRSLIPVCRPGGRPGRGEPSGVGKDVFQVRKKAGQRSLLRPPLAAGGARSLCSGEAGSRASPPSRLATLAAAFPVPGGLGPRFRSVEPGPQDSFRAAPPGVFPGIRGLRVPFLSDHGTDVVFSLRPLQYRVRRGNMYFSAASPLGVVSLSGSDAGGVEPGSGRRALSQRRAGRRIPRLPDGHRAKGSLGPVRFGPVQGRPCWNSGT